MLLRASPAKLQECMIDSIFCLEMPLRGMELFNTINTMMLEVSRSTRRKKTQRKVRSQKEQKTIDEAKALLMDRNHLSENEAHKYIQKLSMDSGNSLVETAEMILAFE